MNWSWQVFNLELRKLVSYRVDFWLQFIGPVVTQLIISYYLWSGIFSYHHVDHYNGFSFYALLLYYLIVVLVEKIVLGPGWRGGISTDIYEGSLSRYLIYPVSYFRYKLLQHLANSLFTILQLGLCLIVFSLFFHFPADFHPTLGSICFGLFLALLASAFAFCLVTLLSLVAFWADNVWSLEVMLRFITALLGGGMLPLNFFPSWAQDIISYLPFKMMLYVPAQAIGNRISTHEILHSVGVMILWALFIVFCCHRLWQKGLKQYTGVGI